MTNERRADIGPTVPVWKAVAERLRQNARFVSRRPGLATRAVANLLAVWVGRPRLRTIDFDVTNVCPLKCAQCYAADFPAPRDQELSVDEFARVAAEARQLGALQANLSGGEALVRRDLPEIIRACRHAGLLVSMCTSGVGLNAARLETLARAGLDVVVFSLDAADAATHDANRGVRGLHQRVLDGIRTARRLGVEPAVNTVATGAKIASGELDAILALIEPHGAVLNLTMPTAIGRWSGRDDLLLSGADRARVDAFLRRPGVRTDTFSTYGTPGCPAGTEKLNVSADGIIRLCPLIEGGWGDVRRESLPAIWARVRPAAQHLRARPFCPPAAPGFRVPTPVGPDERVGG